MRCSAYPRINEMCMMGLLKWIVIESSKSSRICMIASGMMSKIHLVRYFQLFGRRLVLLPFFVDLATERAAMERIKCFCVRVARRSIFPNARKAIELVTQTFGKIDCNGIWRFYCFFHRITPSTVIISTFFPVFN
jgi:hypothetical protein